VSLIHHSDHRSRVNLMHARNDISINKVTHGGRTFAPSNARQHRATKEDAKSLGNWSQGGAYDKSYDRALPTEAMLAAASFHGQKQELFFVARDELGM
jgi:hypothetical protein